MKPVEPLPDVPRKSILRKLSSPPKKLKFEVEFLDDVDVKTYEVKRVFRINTTHWRKLDALVRKTLHRGTWKISKGIYVHVASGTKLLESGFHTVLLSDRPWPPVKKPALVCPPLSTPESPSPPASARASNPWRVFGRLHL